MPRLKLLDAQASAATNPGQVAEPIEESYAYLHCKEGVIEIRIALQCKQSLKNRLIGAVANARSNYPERRLQLT